MSTSHQHGALLQHAARCHITCGFQNVVRLSRFCSCMRLSTHVLCHSCCQVHRTVCETCSTKLVALSAKLVHNLKNTYSVCNYRRDSPCVALRVAVEEYELVHLGALISYPSNDDDDCLHGVDGNGLKSNRQSAHFGDCVISVSKIIEKNPGSIIMRPKNIIKKRNKK